LVPIISAFLHSQPRFSSSPKASAIGGDEYRGSAFEFGFRYLAPHFNKEISLTGKDPVGVFGQAEWKQSASPSAHPLGFFLR